MSLTKTVCKVALDCSHPIGNNRFRQLTTFQNDNYAYGCACWQSNRALEQPGSPVTGLADGTPRGLEA